MLYTDIVDNIIKAEGYTYTNHPADKGGPTKYGITLSTLRNFGGNLTATAADVQALTQDQAAAIYYGVYVKPFIDVVGPDERLSTVRVVAFLINTAVQHGMSRAVQVLQEAYNRLTYTVKPLVCDGGMGPRTVAALRYILDSSPYELLTNLVKVRGEYYISILDSHPDQRVFALGWMRRLVNDI